MICQRVEEAELSLGFFPLT